MKMQNEEKRKEEKPVRRERSIERGAIEAEGVAMIIADERDEQVENNEGDKRKTTPRKEHKLRR